MLVVCRFDSHYGKQCLGIIIIIEYDNMYLFKSISIYVSMLILSDIIIYLLNLIDIVMHIVNILNHLNTREMAATKYRKKTLNLSNCLKLVSRATR